MVMLAPAQKTRGFALPTITTLTPGVLESKALNRVCQLDVHAEVVGVQLQLVPRPEGLVGIDVHVQPGDRPVDRELPVRVAAWIGLEVGHGKSVPY